MNVLLTGAAGFIGLYTAEALLLKGHHVTGFDNLNAYYDPALKNARLQRLRQHDNFRFMEADLANADAVANAFRMSKPQRVVHLAAQAGVRYSILNPHAVVQSNIVGFLNVLEECKKAAVEHLVFASSSSVYGLNTKMPYSEADRTDNQASLYGASKKANELMAHVYSHQNEMPTTGLRFFTVYGPWGRPDMAPFHFTKSIIEGRPIDVYNNGQHARDFTYIDDIIEGVMRVFDRAPDADADGVPMRLYNIGHNSPVPLLDFIACIERAVGRESIKVFQPKQPGDVIATFADIDDLHRDTGFRPTTQIETGMEIFVAWYRQYYNV